MIDTNIKFLNIFKKIIIAMCALFLLVTLISIIDVDAETSEKFDIKIVYQKDEQTVEVASSYDNDLKSAVLTDYNDKVGGAFEGWTPDKISGTEYEAAFAGWKLVSINGNNVSGNYYYPDNDYIYSNDAPFDEYEFSSTTEIVLEPFYGKRIYLRDKYNYVDLSNAYEDVSSAKVDWDTKLPYAYSIAEASNEGIANIGNSASNPVSNMTDALTLLGTSGGEIVTVNHYTFMAPENYYTYGQGYDPSKISTTYFINLGKDITDGVLTFTGYGYGTDGAEKEKEWDRKQLSVEKFNDYYANAHWYNINTRGNSTTPGKGIQFNFMFLCDTVLESLNMVGMREIYTTSKGRYNNDMYFYAGTNKRFVTMPSFDIYKRTTSTTGVNATNFAHSKNEAGHAALVEGGSGYLQLYFGAYSKNDGTENIYGTLYGEKTANALYDSYYHIHIQMTERKIGSRAAVSKAKINNVHLNCDYISSNNIYGLEQGTSYTFNCDYFGMSVTNSLISTVQSTYNTKETTINELVMKLGGTEKYDSTTNKVNRLTSVYAGGFLNESSGKTLTFNANTIKVFTLDNVAITNLYGGGNQVGVKVNVSNSLYININGGTISNLYGGSEGGDFIAGNYIDINVNAGVVGNLFGGGAGGITVLYQSSSPQNIPSYSHNDDYTIVYTYNQSNNKGTMYYEGVTFEIKEMNYVFSDSSKSYDVLTYQRFYPQSGVGVLSNYYCRTMNVCLSNAFVKTGKGINININGGTISKSVYGGGKNGAVTSEIAINLNGGRVKENVYGGGLGRDTKFSTEAGVSGPSGIESGLVTGLGYNVYYTGNISAWNSEKFTDVMVNNNDSVYNRIINYLREKGYNETAINTLKLRRINGENIANFNMLTTDANGSQYLEVYSDVVDTLGKISGNTNIVVDGGRVDGSVYGGSDGAVAQIEGSTNVYAIKGTIKDSLYGGGNVAVVTEDSNVTVNNINIANIYGGGNIGPINGNTFVTVDGTTKINNVFAGSNQANVGGKTNLIINSGTITNAYGGNNLSGVISTSINTQINGGKITNVYGGGNEADTELGTSIEVSGGTIENVYGGGNQADVKNSNITLNGTQKVTNVYGGGYSGNVTTTTEINFETGEVEYIYGGGYEGDIASSNISVNNSTIKEEIYGGGYNGDVTSSTNITLTQSKATTVYGGGFQGEVLGQTNIILNQTSQVENIYGGGYAGDITISNIEILNSQITNNVYGGGYKGHVNEESTIEITNSKATSVYGGGFEGDVKGTSKVIINEGTSLENIYGGGQLGDVEVTTITYNEGEVENIYGGGYQGDINSSEIKIKSGIIDTIYGGGFEGNVIEGTNIDITKGTINKNVYGGGYKGEVNTTKVSIKDETLGDIQIKGNVFGGGEGVTATVHESTEVMVDLKLSLTVVEQAVDTESVTQNPSGESACSVTIQEGHSKIEGNVFGGGDLGQVGDGVINTSNNTATITKAGGTKVTINNGYIGGSVFGGGSGVPKSTQSYELKMGTVFGYTNTNVYGGYVNGNVYGGGTQSRVYFNSGETEVTTATKVIIDETINNEKIVIKGSVFGGGDRGNSATTNASVPTTVGNVSVTINGNENGSSIYFLTGGVYGDGNLCLVTGTRKIELNNYKTSSIQSRTTAPFLKTFRSLQRADEVILNNTDIVLLGAIDLVEEGDITVYSINRIGNLKLTNGSTVKLDQIVKYLGSVESDYDNETLTPDRTYIYQGDNGENNYGTTEKGKLITDEERTIYYSSKLEARNVICVANGLYLEIMTEKNEYGEVVGLFTLQLLRATPGEGGGFVYASIEKSIGTFMCETKMSEDDSSPYMKIIGNVSGKVEDTFTYYCWFIQGNVINYSVSISGYIGSSEEQYEEKSIIPEHNVQLDYLLQHVTGNSVLEAAITKPQEGEARYTLVALTNEKTNLTGQEIALELVLGEESLGFLEYNQSTKKFSIQGKQGYQNNITEAEANILKQGMTVTNENNEMSIILHKSKEVNAETNNMQVEVQLDLFYRNGTDYTLYSDGTSKLVFKIGFSIVRLVPVQYLYTDNDKMYSGVSASKEIKITNGSSFTIEYQTRYIPKAFPDGSNTMKWSLDLRGYNYYIDELGNYMTLDSEGNVVSISKQLTLTPGDSSKILVTKNASGLYEYQHDNKPITFTQIATSLDTYIPKGTKIIMIDMTDTKSPTYYYYVCNERIEDELNLDDFYIMGTTTTIKASGKTPEYKNQYILQEASRKTERLIFVFDLEEVEKEEYTNLSDNVYNGNIILSHGYGNESSYIDIMDYVKSETNNDATTYVRSAPKIAGYKVHPNKTGVDEFEVSFKEETNYEKEVAIIKVEVSQDNEYVNTNLSDGTLGIKIEVIDETDLPDGLEFVLNGQILPKYGNKYLIIPIKNFGTYEVQVINLLGTIGTHNDFKQAKYKAQLCHLPNEQYYNETIMKEIIIDTEIDCTIEEKVEEAMKVEVSEDVISQGSQTLEITLYTKNTKEEYTQVIAYQVGANGLMETNAIRPARILGTTEGTRYTISISQIIEKGTYALVFINGDKVETVSIIIN